MIQKPEWLVSAERANQFIAELVVHELVGIEEEHPLASRAAVPQVPVTLLGKPSVPAELDDRRPGSLGDSCGVVA